jgi:hypothetical protein
MPDEKGPAEAPEGKKVDEGWKKKAREEKSKPGAAGAGPSAADTAGVGPSVGPPRADFVSFVSGLAVQVMVSLGALENPAIKKTEVDLDQAKYLIDLLEVIQDKTKGNLTEDEEKTLATVLYDLRVRYVAAAG